MLSLLASGCGLWTDAGGRNTLAEPPSSPSYQGLNSNALGPHRARFELSFSGDPSWGYTLTTRVGEGATERSVQVQGVADARNPGQVRMVTSGGESRMKGPGTNQACLRVPSDMELNVTFLSPDDVIPPEAINEPLVPMGEATVAGRAAQHVAIVQSELDRWQDVRLGLWLDRETQSVLRYELAGAGWDPFFQAGFGELDGRYEVVEIGPQSIEPIEGCEVEVPLPEGAADLVRLPGLVAFEVDLELEQVVSFYREAMPEAGWQSLVEEERSSGAVVLTYLREAERIEVMVRSMGDRTRVELLTDE